MSEPLLPHPADEPGVPDADEADLTADGTDGDASRPSRLPRPGAGERLTADELQQELDAD